MQSTRPDQYSNQRSYGSIAHEIATGIRNVIRSELNLAKVEAKQTANQVARHTALVIGFGVVALLGLLPLLAFMVIGLGNLLNDRYWLSSLIVAVVMLGVGGGLAYRSMKKLKTSDYSFPWTRDAFQDERNTVVRSISDVRDSTTRRRMG